MWLELADDQRRRLIGTPIALAVILLVGTIGYHQIGDGRWSLFDCLYMTVITVTTVGYGEALDGMDGVPLAREFTIVLILGGMGVFLYFVSHVAAIIIEGELQRAVRKTRMKKTIAELKNHVVVCGAGSTGRHVVEELVAAGYDCVAVDIDESALERIARAVAPRRLLYLVGDATDDVVLEATNIAQASGIVAAMGNDKDNVYLVISARQANPGARIIARGSGLMVLEKLRKAGAETVISPNFIGGMRMVSELIRPHVVRFLDEMLRDRDRSWRIEEIEVGSAPWLVGRTLEDLRLRDRFGVSVLAVREDEEGRVTYNPGADFRIETGSTLIVLGRLEQVGGLRVEAR